MKNTTAKDILNKLQRKRLWLAEKTGYAESYINNKFSGPEKLLPARFAIACQKAFDDEQKRQSDIDVLEAVTNALQKNTVESVPTSSQSFNIWDKITFTATQSMQHAEAAKLQGFTDLADYFKFAICHYTDNALNLKPVKPNSEKGRKTA